MESVIAIASFLLLVVSWALLPSSSSDMAVADESVMADDLAA